MRKVRFNEVNEAVALPRSRARWILARAIAAWRSADVSADLSSYDRGIDALCATRGGAATAIAQLIALRHRLASSGAEIDPETRRDLRLLDAAIRNIYT